MKRINNNEKFLSLRANFKYFEYQSYKFNLSDEKLIIEFNFSLSGQFLFSPKLEVPIREFYNKRIDKISNLDNIIFHLGMIELISYWKIACPPKIIIRPKLLNSEQVLWWKKLYFNGLGEFFYLNNIETDEQKFVEIESGGTPTKMLDLSLDDNKVIVPIGGGKDSVVSLELLKKSDFEVFPMMINPSPAAIRTIENAGFVLEDSLEVKRYLDKTMLELNEKGFLNGHTPFSAMLAFTNVLVSIISGIANIALSNENSANESTVPGTNINHQYSKSYEFEEDFDFYVKKYIHPGVNYFSFLRPLNELQIARFFSGLPKHFSTFRSCNVGSKKDEWCGNCPKCLFTYIILSPFIENESLERIFKKDLFSDQSLKPILMELSGNSAIKPFECVGTVSEVNAALARIKKVRLGNDNRESLLFLDELSYLSKNDEVEKLLGEFNNENNLSEGFLKIIKSELYD